MWFRDDSEGAGVRLRGKGQGFEVKGLGLRLKVEGQSFRVWL